MWVVDTAHIDDADRRAVLRAVRSLSDGALDGQWLKYQRRLLSPALRQYQGSFLGIDIPAQVEGLKGPDSVV